MSGIPGIHHVSSISTNPARTLAFYSGVLGMRLVKRTVNFDDISTLHLYFGDYEGSPGSLLTFFPWPRGNAGRIGVGQVAVTSLSIAPSSLGYWLERLVQSGVRHSGPVRRDVGNGETERVISFEDPDGLKLELVAHASVPDEGARAGVGGVPAGRAVRGIHGVTLWVESSADTARVLADTLGFRESGAWESTRRFETGSGGPGTLVDVREVGGFLKGAEGTGTVHHVAFRVPDDEFQLEMRQAVREAGISTTRVMDRNYFRSIYFREPGGVLFELATDAPGFTVDEPLERLGEKLMLPPRYEMDRPQLEAELPHVPSLEELRPGGGDRAADYA